MFLLFMERKVPDAQHKKPILSEEDIIRFIFLMRDERVKNFAFQSMPDNMPSRQLLQYLIKLFDTITPDLINSQEALILVRNLTAFFNTCPISAQWICGIMDACT